MSVALASQAEVWVSDALAADGGIVRLRPVRSEDAQPLLALYSRSSAENLRLRFFGVPGRAVLEAEVARLVRPVGPDHHAWVAESKGVIVGVGSYERNPPTNTRAEFALFVDEAHHGRGIGTLVLEHLIASARRRGVTELFGQVLPANVGMLRVASDLSGHSGGRVAGGVVDVAVSTTLDDVAAALADARDRTAERASLRPLFAPRAVAVVGVGRQAGGIGHATLQAIAEYGFTGALYAVNPHATSIGGVPCYPSLTAVPEHVDLAVIAVPAAAVPGALADAASAGVPAAVVLSAGFADAGADGRRAEEELVALARSSGIRLVGPNCLGVLNTDPAVRLAATFAPVLPPPGGLALASQSGAVGIAVLDHAARTGVGLSRFVSLGNKADVSGNDLLSSWFDDPATTAVALYLESVGNPRRFGRLARALGRRKPVLAVIAGRSTAGRRAGVSHTAAAASPAAAVDTLCAQAGIIRADHLGELLDAARMLTDQPLPAGNRLAVLGNAGGVNVLAADAADVEGLRVPEVSGRLRTQLADLAPEAGNPLDLGAGATPAGLARALDLFAEAGEVDAVLVVVAATRANDIDAALAALAPVVDRHPRLPLAAVVIGLPGVTSLGHRRAPVFELPERAVSALGKAARYAQWRREPLGGQPMLSGVDRAGARAGIQAALARGGGWQSYESTAAVLRRYGIPVLSAATAVGEQAVVAEAQRIGFPVAIKSADPELVHKTDIGAVKLNVADRADVRAAYRGIAAAVRDRQPAVLVQPMAAGEVELVAGIGHDARFGSLVMLGLGGVHTEIFGDRAFRLVPLTDRDAGQMWRSLRAAPLLEGYRGTVVVSTAAVEDLLLRLAAVAEDLPEVAELDLNPVLAGRRGVVVVDAKMRLADVGLEPDALLRQLGRSR